VVKTTAGKNAKRDLFMYHHRFPGTRHASFGASLSRKTAPPFGFARAPNERTG
jgi:hypothetical protein